MEENTAPSNLAGVYDQPIETTSLKLSRKVIFKRFLGYGIDRIPFAIIAISFIFLNALKYSQTGQALVPGGFEIILVNIFVPFLILSYSLLFTLFSGATPGKRFFGFSVTDITGNRPTHEKIIIREILGCTLSEILFLGYLYALFNPSGQTVHDAIAKTRVSQDFYHKSIKKHLFFYLLLWIFAFFLFPFQLILGIYDEVQGNIRPCQDQSTHITTVGQLYTPLNFPDKICEIDLHGQNLQEFPMEILNYKNIKILDLTNNKLTSLPSEIGELNQLVILLAYNNHLRSLPESIGGLNNLRRLWVSCNDISQFPQSLFHLNKLKDLSIGGNPAPQAEYDRIVNSFKGRRVPMDLSNYCYRNSH